MQNRNEALELAKQTEFDVVIIGGGIVGAGVAQDAASRGLSVLLVEKDDFASGTSSKTTKLIHGGLRYLEQFQLRLTRELCHERALLEGLAPHMVKDFSFILPVTDESWFFGVKARMGLTLYDTLAWNVGGARRHHNLSKKAVADAVPALDATRIKGALRFHDCITDDARLVLEVIKSAASFGATAINYLEARGFEIENGRVTKVRCRDRYSGSDIEFSCKSCVNAAGVWTDELMHHIDPQWSSRVAPAKGVHIMVPASAFETTSALFLPTGDGRYVFVVPWQKALMIGTTDTQYNGDIDEPLPQEEEVDYLLSVVNRYTSGRKLQRDDIIAAWAGLRPLVGGEQAVDDRAGGAAPGGKASAGTSKKTATLSREHYLFEGPGGIVGLIGGKLTNYRMLAIHVIDKIVEKLPETTVQSLLPTRTAKLMLGGWEDKQDYLTTTAEISARARRLGLEPATIEHLTSSYGKDALKVLDIVERDTLLNKRICRDFPPIMAEVVFSVRHEMAVSIEDVMHRRIRLALIHQGQTLEAAEKVARLMQSLVGWDETRTELEIRTFCERLKDHMVWTEKEEQLDTV